MESLLVSSGLLVAAVAATVAVVFILPALALAGLISLAGRAPASERESPAGAAAG